MNHRQATTAIATAVVVSLVVGFGLGRLVPPRAQEVAPLRQPASQASERPTTVNHAIDLNEEAMNILIRAGLSGNRQAMLISSLNEKESFRKMESLQKNGISEGFKEYSDELLFSVDHWQHLMKGALGRSGHLRGHGDREGEERILEALTNIAEANASGDRMEFERLLAEEFLEVIAETKRRREQYDP